ncbi:hypothetical protein [Paraurantiacibacter namhicola]|uniref:Uncharacterized protein n=1 Tax=Paraurantiacibacter namhicola TaxID=645517 RepID=A0A1C7D5E2_9SPHN|nr:hypothetical protein [Paraurantiacibacter namhicola]ANU06541.1 hypothetical protein A6F65_00214 [Paraurantiacibacter namhicola]
MTSSRSTFSQITETSERLRLKHLGAALFSISLGALAGSGWISVWMLIDIAESPYFDFANSFGLVLAPLGVAWILTAIGFVVIGLPLTMMLSESEGECPKRYAAAGAFFGFLVPAFITSVSGLNSQGLLLFALPGLAAGAVTGMSWGRWRARFVNRSEDDNSRRRSNPIHDLIH